MPEIDVTKPQPVGYCIPTWVRDEQIKLSIARVKGRLQKTDRVKRKDPIAVVCYGPSLNATWRKIKKFKYIISCSGAHKFLIERGIIPTWHLEVDPRKHKAELIGKPHKKVEYLISSTCHQKVFDLLEGYNVKLWHVFDSAEEGFRILPHGEWAVTGGSNAGLRAMTMASFLGFDDLHIFGMDGCYGKSGKHAAKHPNQPKDSQPVKFNGKTFRSSIGFVECARQTFHELDQLPGVKAKFYGTGLVQEMAKKYVPKPISKEESMVAVQKRELISDEYRKLNEDLHRTNVAYGVGAARHAPIVLKLAQRLKTTSILDYGCGKGYLAKSLPFPIWEYDPAIPGKTDSPRPADIVVCTDVLEHIEPDHLDPVLMDLRRCMRKIGYLVIHTGPSTKKLGDGRNAHLIQEKLDWWTHRLRNYFEIGSLKEVSPHIIAVVAPKSMPKEVKKAASREVVA